VARISLLSRGPASARGVVKEHWVKMFLWGTATSPCKFFIDDLGHPP
jgi:hypothetical protein